MPALPLGEAGRHAAAAYVLFLAVVVLYLAIMRVKVARLHARLDALESAEGDER